MTLQPGLVLSNPSRGGVTEGLAYRYTCTQLESVPVATLLRLVGLRAQAKVLSIFSQVPVAFDAVHVPQS